LSIPVTNLVVQNLGAAIAGSWGPTVVRHAL
jgi:hypothetical protein